MKCSNIKVALYITSLLLLLIPQSVSSKTSSTELTPVTLQLMWKHQFESAGFYAAVEQGYYQELGLEVTIREYQQDTNLVTEVVSGRAQYGISDSSLIIDRSKGAPVVLLANIFQHSPIILLTLAESKIYSPAQMIGKSMMLSGHEKNNASITAMLNSESVSLQQIEVREHSLNVDDLINRKVDIISAYTGNQPGVLSQLGIKFNIIDPINYGIDFYGNNIFTSETQLQDNPQQVADFIKASLKGWKYALKHPAEMIELILSNYSSHKTRQALAYEAKVLQRFILPDHISLGTVDRQRMERIVDTYKQLKLLPQTFSLDGFLYKFSKTNNSKLNLSDKQQNWIKQNPQVIMGVDPDWAPFEFINEKGEYSGMGADYIQLIAEKTGLDFVVQDNSTWRAVMENARSGKLDLLTVVMKSRQRSEFLYFSKPHIKYPMVIVTAKEDVFISSLEDLNHKKVTVVKDYVTEELLRTYHPGIELIPVDNLQQALKLISSGEVDGLVDNLASISYMISQLGISNLRISGTTPYEFSLGVAVPKRNRTLLKIIQKAMATIGEEEHQKIRNKWISVNYSQAIDYSNIIKISIGVILFVLIILIWNWRLAREVKARIIVEDALRNSEVKFRTLVEKTNVVAWELVIETFQFTYVSPHAEDMFGYPLAKWEEENFWIKHVCEEDLEKTLEYCVAETKKGRDHICEYRMRKADGGTIWLRDIVTVHKDDNGIPVAMSGVFIDIDESKKYEEMLENAKLSAEQANRSKSEFLATMSHELRTPLNGVLGMAQLLKESDLTDEQQEDVGIIVRSGNSLLAIINDVLDLSKLEAEMVSLEARDFNLEQLCQEVLDMFVPEGKRKNIDILMSYPVGYPRYFVGDSLRLQQILINLVGNAVKFTSEGSVRLIILCQHCESQQVELTLSIQDTGEGIAAENTTHLFNPFIQADQSTTRKFGGTGLGLAVSKKLIQLMNGKIGVDTELGKGSTFWITFSLPRADEQYRVDKEPSKTLAKSKITGKILLVEDDKINQLVALGMLRKMGLEVDLAENGQQATNLWKNGAYDLIFMDCRMPVMDGYEATKVIRALETEPLTPIVALTASSSSEDRQRCMDSGMNDVITKPFTTEYLFESLKQWLDYDNQYVEDQFIVADSNQIENGGVDQEHCLDIKQLEKFRLEMGKDSDMILDKILQDFEAFFMKFNKNETLVFQQELVRMVHGLKSRGAHLGAMKLVEIAAEIEVLVDESDFAEVASKIHQLKQEYIRVKVDLATIEI